MIKKTGFYQSYGNKGMTVIELLIIMVLAVLVAGLSYSVYDYLDRSYNNIARLTDLQESVRLSLVSIESMIEFTDSLEIRSLSPEDAELSSLSGNQAVIYLDENSRIIVCKDGAKRDLLGAVGEKVPFSLSFNKIEDDKVGGKLLSLQVTGSLDERDYVMSSEIYLINLSEEILGNTGPAIIFTI